MLLPGEGRAVRAKGARGWRERERRGEDRRAGGGAGRRTESPQVLGPEPRGQTRPGRASAGARGCKCAMRARRGGCVSPLSPSSPAGPGVRRGGERTPQPQPLSEQLRGPRRLAAAHSRAGSEEQRRPRAGAQVPAPNAPESEPGAERARERAARRLPRLGEAAGPARRPPKLFPFSLHPLAPSRTPRRETRPVCSSCGGRSLRRSPTGARVLSEGRGARSQGPRTGGPRPDSRGSTSPRVWPIPPSLQGEPGAPRRLSKAASGLSRLLGAGLPPAPGP